MLRDPNALTTIFTEAEIQLLMDLGYDEGDLFQVPTPPPSNDTDKNDKPITNQHNQTNHD